MVVAYYCFRSVPLARAPLRCLSSLLSARGAAASVLRSTLLRWLSSSLPFRVLLLWFPLRCSTSLALSFPLSRVLLLRFSLSVNPHCYLPLFLLLSITVSVLSVTLPRCLPLSLARRVTASILSLSLGPLSDVSVRHPHPRVSRRYASLLSSVPSLLPLVAAVASLFRPNLRLLFSLPCVSDTEFAGYVRDRRVAGAALSRCFFLRQQRVARAFDCPYWIARDPYWTRNGNKLAGARNWRFGNDADCRFFHGLATFLGICCFGINWWAARG